MLSRPGRKICFISSRAGKVSGTGTFLMDGANGLLIRQLIDAGPKISSVAIFSNEEQNDKYNFEIQADQVYSLPFPFSYKGGIINFRSFRRILKRIAAEHDILIIQLPFIGFLALPFIHKPVVYHVCANVLTAAANPVKYKGIKLLASTWFAGFMHRVYIRLFSRNNVQVLVNGSELGELYKEYHPQVMISSSIQQVDILPEQEVTINTQGPIRLFFVGRPSLEKGFDTLIKALQNFPADFVLTIVGFTSEEFRAMLPQVYENSTGLHDKLEFRGYVGWESGLKDIIRMQDIAIVPSRSEGTPRVILECMSQGVPVIASDTGGIPTIICHEANGILVEPGNAPELAQKIMMLWKDDNRRKELILNALKTAKQNTIEQFTRHFTQAIERLSNE